MRGKFGTQAADLFRVVGKRANLAQYFLGAQTTGDHRIILTGVTEIEGQCTNGRRSGQARK